MLSVEGPEGISTDKLWGAMCECDRGIYGLVASVGVTGGESITDGINGSDGRKLYNWPLFDVEGVTSDEEDG